MTQRLVALLSVALLVPPVAASGAPHVLAVRCGTLIVDTARPPLHDATIIITDGIITGVGAGLAIPPGAEELDRLTYRTVVFGFPIWTFGIIAGAI